MSKYVSSGKLVILVSVLAANVLIATIGQDDIAAQDKSTSITCSTGEACEKTECINDVCETTTTNTTNISISDAQTDNEPDRQSDTDTRESIADSVEDRLKVRDE